MMIATKLHVLASLVDDPLVSLMMAAPKFVVSDEVMRLLPRDDVQKSIAAMIEAGICKLPYDPVLIEFAMIPQVRRFVLLAEAGGNVAGVIGARSATLFRDDRAIVQDNRMQLEVMSEGLLVHHFTDQTDALAVGLAGAVALMMLNTKGIDKDVIETERLNRARLKSGKAQMIPQHTVVRIGTIYDRSGRGHAAGTTGRRMPVHLRSAFVRNQAFGKNWEEHRLVYIPPVLVNYREGDDVPVPTKVLRQ